MSILVFDLGGTSVKYGVWDEHKLVEQGSFLTPTTWQEMTKNLKHIQSKLESNYHFEGVALATPGSVDVSRGVIGGISAIEYIHHFNIVDELQDIFGLPVSIENDANCAALAETWLGSAKNDGTMLFVVVGTGIGGAVVIDGVIERGHNLFGGEFGCMILDGETSFSLLGTAVHMAERYNHRTNHQVSGEEVFKRSQLGDSVAVEEVEKFYSYLALGIYNLQFTLDPSCIVIGGAVSKHEPLIPELMKRLDARLLDAGLSDIKIQLRPAYFHNDANLIGAVYSNLSKFDKEDL